MGDTSLSLRYLKQGLIVAEKIGHTEDIMEATEALSNVYKTLGQHDEAYNYHKRYLQVKDTLFNEESSKEIGRLEAQREWDLEKKKEKAEALALAKSEAKKTHKRHFIQYIGIVGFFILLMVLLFVLTRLKVPVAIIMSGIFISILLLFEFVLILADPKIEYYTGGAPLWKYLISTVVSFIFFPLHRLLTRKMKRVLLTSPPAPLLKERREGPPTITPKGRKRKPTFNLFHKKGNKRGGLLVVFLVVSVFHTGFYFTSSDYGKDTTQQYNNSTIEQFNHSNNRTFFHKFSNLFNKKKIRSQIDTLNQRCWQIKNMNPEKAMQYAQQQLELAQQIKDKLHISRAYNNIGVIHKIKGNYPEAMKYHHLALDFYLQNREENKKGIAAIHNNIGEIFRLQGDHTKALRHYFKGLKLLKELKNKGGTALILNNIGIVYFKRKDYDKAIEYYTKSLKTRQKLGDKEGIADCSSNIGIVFRNQGDHERALKIYKKTLNSYKALNNKRGMANVYNNIGVIHRNEKNYQTAIRNFTLSLNLRQETGDKLGIATSWNNLAEVYKDQNKHNQAIEYYTKSLEISKEVGALEGQLYNYQGLNDVYEKRGDYKHALEYLELSGQVKDSLNNEEKARDIGKVEAHFEYEMAEMRQKSLLEERANEEAMLKFRRNMMQYSAIFFGLMLFFGIIFFLGNFLIADWILDGLTFVSFVLLFDFILVFTDPYTEFITGGEPALRLIINTLIAGMLFPLHRFLEQKLRQRVFRAKRSVVVK